ncbi:unnamed protein product [Periconia digitata]|uniref:G-patch domain-containing protein n=1 Tax=Periconia digitata TaxID=1303443 RepID=A0A9W4U4C3_9PLEO|nr:unnamed protein product [Periconia digitata]
MAFKRPRANSPTAPYKRTRGEGQSGYVLLGTELPPDKDSDDGAFVPEWKQTVTDERGRRRLHGAFTGGFSAGYFNTVGSKEGWAPSAFVSSRTNRKADAAQRAEDFMDEEDLAEAAQSRELETAQSAAAIGRVGEQENDAFFGLFVTEEETMGIKIAQKMGWRRNQGIGRKIRRIVHLEDDGRSASKDGSSSNTFAPTDSRVMAAAPQDINRKGLGYQSEARLGTIEAKETRDRPMLALSFLETPKKQPLKKIAQKKSSFGVGVLNDTGSDDEDPYELGPKITFNKTLGKEKKAKKTSKLAKAGGSDAHVYIKKATSKAAPRTTYDGRPPLRGFILAVEAIDLTNKRKYPPPSIPPGWKSAKSGASTAATDSYTSVADAAKASTLDAKARASLLGETLLPGKSVFDFLSKEARDRLANLTGKSDLPQGLGEAAPKGHASTEKNQPKDLWSFVPVLDKTTAAGALSSGATGWMPYGEDLKKRARYVTFLELRSGKRSELPERPNNMSISEWAKELEGFAQAAIAFRPATGLMASRFTSSTSSSHPGSGDRDKASETLLRKPAPKPEDPAEQAAKLGMYGAMTRQKIPFHPSALLCKRFGVAVPPLMPHDSEFGNAEHMSKSKTGELVNEAAMNKIKQEVMFRGASMMQRPAWMNEAPKEPRAGDVPPRSGEVAAKQDQQQHATVDIEKNEVLARGRASEDVFKAIFGDDDDDDDEEDEA